MIVSVLLNLVITIPVIIIILVIVPMIVGLHDFVFIRLAIVRAILRADQHRRQGRHRNSRHCEQCWFPKMLAHVAFLDLGLGVACYGRPNQAAMARRCNGLSARAYARRAEVPIQPDVS